MQSCRSTLFVAAILFTAIPNPSLHAQFGGGGEYGNSFAEKSSSQPFESGEVHSGPIQPCRCTTDNREAEQRIKRILRQSVSESLEFIDEPMESVLARLADEYDLPIIVDTQAMDDVGIGPDEPITIDVDNLSLRSALQLMLNQLDLTWIIKNETLLITTPEEAETMLSVCVYDVRDLVQGKGSSSQLVDAILALVATESWAAKGGGEAEIRVLPPGLLGISQTQAVHDEIQQFLDAVRRAQGKPPAPSEP